MIGDLRKDLLHLWYTFGDPSLNEWLIIAQTKLVTHGRPDRRTSGHRPTQTNGGKDNTRSPKLASGKKTQGLIFNMRIPIPGKDGFYIENWPSLFFQIAFVKISYVWVVMDGLDAGLRSLKSCFDMSFLSMLLCLLSFHVSTRNEVPWDDLDFHDVWNVFCLEAIFQTREGTLYILMCSGVPFVDMDLLLSRHG